jgi:hypothetical protein
MWSSFIVALPTAGALGAGAGVTALSSSLEQELSTIPTKRNRARKLKFFKFVKG